MHNKVWVADTDDDVEKLLKARLIHESEGNYWKDALHMYVENESAMKKNEAVLTDLTGEPYTIESNHKITDDVNHPLTTVKDMQNQKQTYTWQNCIS